MPEEQESMTVKETALAQKKARTTISTWLHKGVINRRTGETITLNYKYDGGQIRITREDVHEFMRAINRTEPLPC